MEQEELRKLEDQCIQEQAPACAATCPIHLDVRAMVGEIARGNLKEASKILRKTVPFPGIVSRVCDHPCEGVCKRSEVGSPVSIRGLERACIDWAGELPQKFIAPPGKDGSIAVAGGGMSGLTAAFDLARKGYSVVVFEKNNRLGGSLWSFSEEDLPRDVIAKDLEVLGKVGVEVRLGSTVGKDIPLPELMEKHGAVFIAVGGSPPDSFGLKLDSDGRIEIDPVTYATDLEGVFCRGRIAPTTRGPFHHPVHLRRKKGRHIPRQVSAEGFSHGVEKPGRRLHHSPLYLDGGNRPPSLRSHGGCSERIHLRRSRSGGKEVYTVRMPRMRESV